MKPDIYDKVCCFEEICLKNLVKQKQADWVILPRSSNGHVHVVWVKMFSNGVSVRSSRLVSRWNGHCVRGGRLSNSRPSNARPIGNGLIVFYIIILPIWSLFYSLNDFKTQIIHQMEYERFVIPRILPAAKESYSQDKHSSLRTLHRN